MKAIHVILDFALNVSVEFQIFQEVTYHRHSIHRVKRFQLSLLQSIGTSSAKSEDLFLKIKFTIIRGAIQEAPNVNIDCMNLKLESFR